MQHLPLDTVIIPDALDGGIDGLAGLQVKANDVPFRLFLLNAGSPINDMLTYLEGPAAHL